MKGKLKEPREREQIKLFRSNGEEAGLEEICRYVLFHYPEDVFVDRPESIMKLREACKEILGDIKKGDPF